MHPILFRIPLPGWNIPWLGQATSLPIYSYGVMLGLSLVVGWYLTLSLAERDGLPPDEMANCYVITAISALVASRVLYILTNPADFDSVASWFAVRKGGLVAYGGFLGGFLGSWAYLRSKRIPLMPWGDVAVPSLATGLLLTRIGCYLFGCDFGKRLSENAPGVLRKLGTFPHWPAGTLDGPGGGSPAWSQHVERHLITPDAAASLPVHPTQLYESAVGLLLFGLLIWQRRRQSFRGQVFLLFTFAYGCLRYLLEMVRDDSERGSFGPLLGEHVLVPGGLFLLAAAFAFGMARAVPERFRLIARVAAFVPAVALYLALRPPNFADQALVKLSTSQWVAVLTGAAAAVAYGIFYDAAKAHPKRAMALGLEAFYAKYGRAGAASAAEASEAEAASAPKKSGKKKKRKAAAAAAAPEGAPAAAGGGPGAAEAPAGGSAPEAESGPGPDKGLEPA
ncbi:MAG TPA: prolipoprotein diacylglyceryl transferase family protein [Polyangiaceae bacterium]|nr:prolipoprotein diacylglyceryl transferase family protein [Polyangiaceae bacterium]